MKKRIKAGRFGILTGLALAGAALMAGCSSSGTASESSAAQSSAESQAETAASPEAVPAEPRTKLVIAGGDGAGLAAAIQAVAGGLDPASIRILAPGQELAEDVKGMEPYVNAANTQEQFDAQLEDDFEIYLADTMAAGGQANDAQMAAYLVESGEMAREWLETTLGLELGELSQQDGSSVARSFPAAEGDLSQKVYEALTSRVEELEIPVTYGAEVAGLSFTNDDVLESVTVRTEEGEETIDCLALIATDPELLPLFEESRKNEAGTALIVTSCAEQIDAGEELIAGLYGAGPILDGAVHGENALAGNELTALVVYGMTAGDEASIYISDNE